MSNELKIDIEVEGDLFILEYRLKKFLDSLAIGSDVAFSILLVSKELATNILKYGGKGNIYIKYDSSKFVIISEDIGRPKDSIFISRGLGAGLELIKKHSTNFTKESKPDGGMIFRVEIDLGRVSKEGVLLDIGVASKPHYLEERSGDIAFYKRIGERYFICVVDILGHGLGAGSVAESVKAFLENFWMGDLWDAYLGIERVLRGTRGGVVFMAFLSGDKLSYINLGNINAFLFINSSLKALSQTNGILGRSFVKPKIFFENLPLMFALIVSTDGVKRGFLSSIDFEKVRKTRAEELANYILSEFGIKEDDATVVVVKRG